LYDFRILVAGIAENGRNVFIDKTPDMHVKMRCQLLKLWLIAFGR
jgi:hypothetical protein